MNRRDIARLLGIAAAYDQRTVGQADVAAWYEALHDLSAQRASEAVVEHYRHHRERIMPADVRRLAIEIGNRQHVDPSFAEILGRDGLRAIEGVADGTRIPAERPESTRDERWTEQMRAALSVHCPYCLARPFHHCRIDLGGRTLPKMTPHPSRVEAGQAAAA